MVLNLPASLPASLLSFIARALQVIRVLPTTDQVTIEAAPRPPTADRPTRGMTSRRIHSVYRRVLSDFPWQGATRDDPGGSATVPLFQSDLHSSDARRAPRRGEGAVEPTNGEATTTLGAGAWRSGWCAPCGSARDADQPGHAGPLGVGSCSQRDSPTDPSGSRNRRLAWRRGHRYKRRRAAGRDGLAAVPLPAVWPVPRGYRLARSLTSEPSTLKAEDNLFRTRLLEDEPALGTAVAWSLCLNKLFRRKVTGDLGEILMQRTTPCSRGLRRDSVATSRRSARRPRCRGPPAPSRGRSVASRC